MQEILDNLKAFHKAGMDEYEATKDAALTLGVHKALQDACALFDKTFCAAEKAVEKQIPKTAAYDELINEWFCPDCGFPVSDIHENGFSDSYCWHCGQAIDWGE